MNRLTIEEVEARLGDHAAQFTAKGRAFLTKRLNGRQWGDGAAVLVDAYVKNRLSHVCGKQLVKHTKAALDPPLATNEGVLIVALGRPPMWSGPKRGFQERGVAFTADQSELAGCAAQLYAKAAALAAGHDAVAEEAA